MANDVIETSPALPGGKALDAEALPGAGPSGQTLYRERVQVTGSTLEQVAAVTNQSPTGTEFALVVRPINGTATTRMLVVSQDLLEQVLAVLRRIETQMSLITGEELTSLIPDGDGEP